MRRFIPILLIPLMLVSPSLAVAQQPAEKPVSTGFQETVKVTLLQIDVLALDGKGRTVPDLKAEDFSMKLGDAPLKVSTVDVTCPIGATDDPVPLQDGATEPPAPIEQPVPVEDPPSGESPTKEPPAGPDEVDPPIRDPRVPGQPSRKQVD